jgi:hypothetical protein
MTAWPLQVQEVAVAKAAQRCDMHVRVVQQNAAQHSINTGSPHYSQVETSLKFHKSKADHDAIYQAKHEPTSLHELNPTGTALRTE